MNFNDFPKYVKSALNSASGPLGGPCYINCAKTNAYLLQQFSLNIDDNSHEIEGYAKINFDWKLEKWYAIF